MSLASTPPPIGSRYMTDKEATKSIERLWREYAESQPRAIHVSIDHLRSALDVITHLQTQLDEARTESSKTKHLEAKLKTITHATCETLTYLRDMEKKLLASPPPRAKSEIERIARAAYEHPEWGHKQPWEKNPWARDAWTRCMIDVLAPAKAATTTPL